MTGNRCVPRFRYISAITNAQAAVVTFTEDHDFTDGEIVSFRVTPPFGMFEINNLQSKVIAHTDTAITTEIDTTFWTPFIYPVSGPVTPPVCVPSASGVIPGSIPATVSLEDCFDNIRT